MRTAEFLWQEGHTAHETKEEALEETELILNVYADFLEKFMAIPVIKGRKTESERFAGALDTYCIEALMQDGKALQAGTSHFLGQNFAKAFDVKFTNKAGKLEHVWATSWVFLQTNRLLVMTHSGDQVSFINLTPFQVIVFQSIRVKEFGFDKFCCNIFKNLRCDIRVKYDKSSFKPGWKFNEYEVKGSIPFPRHESRKTL